MDNKQLAECILKYIGSADNIDQVFHCATRLRFSLKDMKKVDTASLKATKGVIGVKESGTSFQVIIGPNVGMVYDELCAMGNLSKNDEVKENLDPEISSEGQKEEKKVTAKYIFDVIITYIMNSIAPIIPVLIGVSIWKTVATLLGPGMLNVIDVNGDFYITCNYFFEALFYFFPLYVGYTAAKQLKVNPIWGMFLGAMIMTPSFMGLVGTRTSIAFFGISVPVAKYSQQFLPVLLGVPVLKYVYKFLEKHVPNIISSLVVPVITVFVMAIVMFAVCAPLGSYLSTLISNVFMYCSNASAPIRIIALTIYTAINPFLILFGLHVTTYVAAVTAAMPLGYEGFVLPAGVVTSFVIYGMSLGAMFKFKKNKGDATSYFISGFVAGITEPSLYGVCMKSKSALRVMLAVGAIGGALLGLLNVKCALMASVNILSLIPYFAVGSSFNLIAGCVIALGSMLLAALGVIMFAKFNEEDK
jgi:PTS system beta-glucosides-specific IIC component